jgi:hypothetical protein
MDDPLHTVERTVENIRIPDISDHDGDRAGIHGGAARPVNLSVEAVENNHVVSGEQQALDEVGANKPRTTGHQRAHSPPIVKGLPLIIPFTQYLSAASSVSSPDLPADQEATER